MAGYDINVGRDLLPGLLSGQNGLANQYGHRSVNDFARPPAMRASP